MLSQNELLRNSCHSPIIQISILLILFSAEKTRYIMIKLNVGTAPLGVQMVKNNFPKYNKSAMLLSSEGYGVDYSKQ